MPDYEKMYFTLFNSVTDAITLLIEAQKMVEEIYIDSSEKEDEEKNPLL